MNRKFLTLYRFNLLQKLRAKSFLISTVLMVRGSRAAERWDDEETPFPTEIPSPSLSPTSLADPPVYPPGWRSGRRPVGGVRGGKT